MYNSFAGYGVFLNLACKKYKLNPEVEINDVHFISYFDQKLYSVGQESQTTDEYCIEFVQLPSGVQVFFLTKAQKFHETNFKLFSDAYICMLC